MLQRPEHGLAAAQDDGMHVEFGLIHQAVPHEGGSEICAGDGFTPSKELTDKIFEEGMKGKLASGGKRYGLVLDIGGYYKNVFTIAPSFTITNKEIDLGIELFEQCMRNAGIRT